jgi:hypothetical protein
VHLHAAAQVIWRKKARTRSSHAGLSVRPLTGFPWQEEQEQWPAVLPVGGQ